jgi:hypothetical protein
MDSRSSKGKGERATECHLGRIWQSMACGTAGVAHTWLHFVVSSDYWPCCDTGWMTSASLDGWISVGAIVLDSYDTRESDLKPVLHRRTFLDGFRIMASIVPLMTTFLVNGFGGAWSLGEVQFLPNNAIEKQWRGSTNSENSVCYNLLLCLIKSSRCNCTVLWS